MKSVFALSAIVSLAACSSDESPSVIEQDNGGSTEVIDRFVIAASSIEHQGVADYLLTSESIDKGSITLKNNGVEQDGKNRYYINMNNKFYSLLYNQGDPGAVTTYHLNRKGKLVKDEEFMTETVQVFGEINNDFVGWKVPRSGNPIAPWFAYNTEANQLRAEGQINTEELAGNGERAHFSGLVQMGDKLLAPYFSMRGIKGDVWGTSFPNKAWVAVYNYPSMELDKVITSEKSSYIGAFFKNGLAVDELGDGYAYSSANVMDSDRKVVSKNPSGIMKIDGKTLTFDDSYFWNIEAASDGHYLVDYVYAGKGNFIARLRKDKTIRKAPVKYAVLNVYNKQLKWVKGLPEDIKDLGFSNKGYYSEKDGKVVYVGITSNQGSFVYKVNIAEATAERGLKVEGGNITYIGKLSGK